MSWWILSVHNGGELCLSFSSLRLRRVCHTNAVTAGQFVLSCSPTTINVISAGSTHQVRYAPRSSLFSPTALSPPRREERRRCFEGCNCAISDSHLEYTWRRPEFRCHSLD